MFCSVEEITNRKTCTGQWKPLNEIPFKEKDIHWSMNNHTQRNIYTGQRKTAQWLTPPQKKNDMNKSMKDQKQIWTQTGQLKIIQREGYELVNESHSKRKIWACQWKIVQRDGYKLVNQRSFKEKDMNLSVKNHLKRRITRCSLRATKCLPFECNKVDYKDSCSFLSYRKT